MKKFRFRLQRLLEVRVQQKRALAAALARLRQRLQALDAERLGMEQVWSSSRSRILQARRLETHELMESAGYLQDLEQRLQRLHNSIEAVRTDMETVRAGFEKAAQGEKVLDNLKARQFEVFMRQVEKIEQQIVDELASQRKWRSRVPSIGQYPTSRNA